MKKVLFLLLCLMAVKVTAQSRVMYPADRCNRIFVSGLTSAITYSVSYSLFNNQVGYKKHLYPIITTIGVNTMLGAVSMAFDKSSAVNKRQNITGWFASNVVTIMVIRIGLN